MKDGEGLRKMIKPNWSQKKIRQYLNDSYGMSIPEGVTINSVTIGSKQVWPALKSETLSFSPGTIITVNGKTATVEQFAKEQHGV